MEGTFRLTLRQPLSVRQGPGGALEVAEWREHEAWATRVDRGGATVVREDLASQEWDVLFRFYRFPSIEKLDQSWEIIGQDDRLYDIQRVGLEGSLVNDQSSVNHFLVSATYSKGSLENLPLFGDVPANALTLNGDPLTLNGEILTLGA